MAKQQFLDLNGLNLLVQELRSYIDNQKVIPYPSRFNFPTVGKQGILYIDEQENNLYRWDDDNLKYYPLGLQLDDIEVIDGGSSVF